MKTIRMLLIVVLVGLMGCEESQMTVWTVTGQQTDLLARVGVEDSDGTEIGVEAMWDVSEDIEEDQWEPDLIGPYLIFNLSQEITITDTPEISPIKDLLESLNARPYTGIAILGSRLDSDIQPQYIGGTKFYLTPDSQWALAVEYTTGDVQPDEVYIGLTGRF